MRPLGFDKGKPFEGRRVVPRGIARGRPRIGQSDRARIARNARSEGQFSLEFEAEGDENLLRWRGKGVSRKPKREDRGNYILKVVMANRWIFLIMAGTAWDRI